MEFLIHGFGLAIAVIWRRTQGMEDLSVSFFFYPVPQILIL